MPKLELPTCFPQSTLSLRLLHSSLRLTIMPPTGTLVQRRWLLALLSSSFALALCSWVFRRSLRSYASLSPKSNSWGHLALSWFHWFITSPSTSDSTSTPNSAPPTLSHTSNPPHSSVYEVYSSNSSDSQLESLSMSRITGNPRVVVLSTRHVRHSTSMVRLSSLSTTF